MLLTGDLAEHIREVKLSLRLLINYYKEKVFMVAKYDGQHLNQYGDWF